MGKRNAVPRVALAALVCVWAAVPLRAQNASLSSDFGGISQWLSQNIADGLAFNSGETFDPPKEVKDRRFQPDISFGAGFLPLNTAQFPATPALSGQGLNPASFFPSQILFPNFVMHLRAGLPWRCDFALRAADMTTPPRYRLSPSISGQGQSNSLGADLRKHFFGRDGAPMLTVGTDYNYVFGRFAFNESLPVNIDNGGVSLNNNIAGALRWSVASYGLNFVLSQQFGNWIPFIGAGYSYVAGSVTASLADYPVPGSIGFTPALGSASSQTSPNQTRALFGWQWTHSWIDYFTEGEIKTTGPESGKTWIVQVGISLPFHIGFKGKNKDVLGVLNGGGKPPAPQDPSGPIFMQ
ncbi:MAG: hypothetical protein ACYCPQ_02385 [Elusimicrobiota bacterium]